MRWSFVLAAGLMALTGCATSPPTDPIAAPADRVFLAPVPAPSGQVTVIRDTGFVASGVYMHIWIDGVKAASLNPGEMATFQLSLGEHQIGAIPTNIGDRKMLTQEFILKEGRPELYRVGVDGNLNVVLNREMRRP